MLHQASLVVVPQPLCGADEGDTDAMDVPPQFLKVGGLVRVEDRSPRCRHG